MVEAGHGCGHATDLPFFQAVVTHCVKGFELQDGLVIVEALYGCLEAMPPTCSRAAVHAEAAEAATPTENGHEAAGGPGALSLTVEFLKQRRTNSKGCTRANTRTVN